MRGQARLVKLGWGHLGFRGRLLWQKLHLFSRRIVSLRLLSPGALLRPVRPSPRPQPAPRSSTAPSAAPGRLPPDAVCGPRRPRTCRLRRAHSGAALPEGSCRGSLASSGRDLGWECKGTLGNRKSRGGRGRRERRNSQTRPTGSPRARVHGQRPGGHRFRSCRASLGLPATLGDTGELPLLRQV